MKKYLSENRTSKKYQLYNPSSGNKIYLRTSNSKGEIIYSSLSPYDPVLIQYVSDLAERHQERLAMFQEQYAEKEREKILNHFNELRRENIIRAKALLAELSIILE